MLKVQWLRSWLSKKIIRQWSVASFGNSCQCMLFLVSQLNEIPYQQEIFSVLLLLILSYFRSTSFNHFFQFFFIQMATLLLPFVINTITESFLGRNCVRNSCKMTWKCIFFSEIFPLLISRNAKYSEPFMQIFFHCFNLILILWLFVVFLDNWKLKHTFWQFFLLQHIILTQSAVSAFTISSAVFFFSGIDHHAVHMTWINITEEQHQAFFYFIKNKEFIWLWTALSTSPKKSSLSKL